MPLTAVIVEDDPPIRRVLKNALSADFEKIVEAATAAAGIDAVAASRPALVILDLGLPDMSGLQVCREIRSWSRVPILVLSARHTDSEKIEMLDAGADDYMTKPFSTAELQARVRAILRRAGGSGEESGAPVTFGRFTMDRAGRTLARDGENVHLTPIEWELLAVLVEHTGRTMTHQQLFNAVWSGRRYGDAQQYLRVHVANLRRKIEDDALDPQFIVTEPGVGYRFAPVT